MIYPAKADIVPFQKGLVQSLRPYADANEVHLFFSSPIKKQEVHYQPFLLSQSLMHLICSIINLLPPKCKINVRLEFGPRNKTVKIEIENTGINLVRANDISAQNAYAFTGHPLSNGTFYSLELPIRYQSAVQQHVDEKNISIGYPPQFYREIQKRLRSQFTKTEKLIAALEQKRPREAAFMQKVNTLIKANLENESFDTNVLCKAMSMSRTQLFRRLKSLIKQAPARYIKAMRLQRAKELLETSDQTVSEIAFKTGFRSLSHFTSIFKMQYGILPTAFRRTTAPATNK